MSFAAIAAALVGLVALAIVAANHPRYLAPIFLAVGLLACRPSVVGERWPWLGPVIILVGTVIALASPKGVEPTRKLPVWPSAAFFAGYLWLILREAIVGDEAFVLTTSTLTVFLPVFAFMLAARNADAIQKASKVFVTLVTASSASVVVSLAIGLVIGFGALRMGMLPIGYEKLGSGLLFPFSLTYGSSSDGVTRFLGLGREPGMGAIFMGYAFFAMPKWRRRNLYRGILLIALAGTQSTAGVGIFAVALGLHFILGRRRVNLFIKGLAVAASGAAIYVALFDTKFGFLGKQDTLSAMDRTRATQAGIEAFLTEPFTATTTAPLSSINMIAGMALTGAPWFGAMALFLLSPVLIGRLRRWETYAGLFILATMLTSQPLYGSTGVMILVVMLLASLRDRKLLWNDYSVAAAAERNLERRVVGGQRGNSRRATLDGKLFAPFTAPSETKVLQPVEGRSGASSVPAQAR